VAAEAVHTTEGARDSTIAHDHSDLVQGLGDVSPEVPVAICAAHAGLRIALDGVVEIGELERITKEEDGCVVSNKGRLIIKDAIMFGAAVTTMADPAKAYLRRGAKPQN
jgi:hypothetical protein